MELLSTTGFRARSAFRAGCLLCAGRNSAPAVACDIEMRCYVGGFEYRDDEVGGLSRQRQQRLSLPSGPFHTRRLCRAVHIIHDHCPRRPPTAAAQRGTANPQVRRWRCCLILWRTLNASEYASRTERRFGAWGGARPSPNPARCSLLSSRARAEHLTIQAWAPCARTSC